MKLADIFAPDIVELLKKIPRPRRSGWASILIYAVLVQSFGMAAMTDDDFRCMLFPNAAGCRSETVAEARQESQPIYFGHGPGDDDCTCFLSESTTTVGIMERVVQAVFLHAPIRVAGIVDFSP